MRITKDFLLKIAKDTISQRKRKEADLHGAYLMGSILDEEPLLGGTTDIDLMIVHKYFAPIKHEVLALTPDLSLDIYHKTLDDYSQLRALRQDAWIGYPLTNSNIILFDTDHWLEYAQSSVSAEFHRSDNVQARVKGIFASAREEWFRLTSEEVKDDFTWLDHFLNALSLGANAISGLIGPPLPTRRFSAKLKERLEILGVPEIWTGFCGLLGCLNLIAIDKQNWLAAFEEDFTHLAELASYPVHLSACRHAYYTRGFRSLAESDDPSSFIFPLIRTWLDIQLALSQPSPRLNAWLTLIEGLNLTENVHKTKIEALDAYLDNLEVLIEDWAEVYGA